MLLIYKKRGFGKGLYNFPGGKFEANEKGEECAMRELQEETGIIAKNAIYRGRITFVLNSEVAQLMEVYLINDFEGQIKETDEAIPLWVNVNQIPYDKMWEDDKEWVRLVLDGYSIDCKFYFSNDWKIYNGGSCKTFK